MKTFRIGLLTFLFALSVCINSNAQLQKGAILLGTHAGFFDYNSINSFPDNYEYITWNSNVNLKSRIGYFFTDNAVLGLGYDYQNNYRENQTQREDNRSTDRNYTSFSSKSDLNQHFLRLFYRQNFKIVKNFYGYLEPSLFYSKGHENSESLSFTQNLVTNNITNTSSNYTDTEISQWGITIMPGLMYMVKPWFGVELSAGILEYSSVEEKTNRSIGSEDFMDNTNDKTNFDRTVADLSFNTFSLGVNFYFKNSPVTSQEN